MPVEKTGANLAIVDAADAYEQHAVEFLRTRDRSTIGTDIVEQWARSLHPNNKVIELACGGGYPVTGALVAADLRVWAIDASPTLIAAFETRFPGVPVQCSPVSESDFFLQKFHAAIAIGLLFLLPERDQVAVIERVSQKLIPGGKFLFTAPVEIWSWQDINTGNTCQSLGRARYQEIWQAAGFELLATYVDEGANNYYEVRKLA